MISDVLSDAVQSIREYQRACPEAYEPIKADIERCVRAMERLRIQLDRPPMAPEAYDMRALPVRRVSIECIEHPEWGTWGVYEDRGGHYEIHGRAGGRILDKEEAARFWRVVPRG